MTITLGSFAFNASRTIVDEQLEEVGGRDARVFTLRGVLLDCATHDDVEAQLDAIAQAASKVDYSAALSLRPGRRFWVRRARFKRHVMPIGRVGAFELVLESRDPFEESVELTQVSWPIGASGATLLVTTVGNADTFPAISLLANGNVIRPAFDDGVHCLLYAGTVGHGQTMVVDGVARKVTLDGKDVTAYTQGEFPSIAPAGTTLEYEDDATSSHNAEVNVSFRDRWW